MGSTPWVPDAHTKSPSNKAGASGARAVSHQSTGKGGEDRNVFVSFDMDDEAQVRLLTYQAKDDKFKFSFRDYSVKEPFDDKWKRRVREKLRLVSAVIVAIGAKTHESDAVDWEIKEAYSQGKTVLGVRLHRSKKHKTPPAVRPGTKVVNWDAEEINRALSQ